MKTNKIYSIFIVLFAILYVASAGISLFHAIDFFSIGNAQWMAIIVASVFEIGQFVVLSSLLLSDNKNTILPWILMIILTTVQVIGNVFAVYKYMLLTGGNYFIYLQQSVLFWIQGIEIGTVQVIIAWILGGLLPILALCMTGMVAQQIKLKNQIQQPGSNDITETKIDNNTDDVQEIKDSPEIKTEESQQKPYIKDLIFKSRNKS